MGGKAEKGTPKYIANKIKAKGLQKLRWYCQMCQKQCRDENGFKCHTMSESHQRQLLLFADNASRYLDEFSREFSDGYLEQLKRQFGTKRVNANKVYQEYISNRDHCHMNSTQWETLTEFVKWLGREGKCVVDETEKGWFVAYIDRDPAAVAAMEAQAKKEKMDKDDQERMQEFIERQVVRGKTSFKTEEPSYTELKRSSSQERLTLNMTLKRKLEEKKLESLSSALKLARRDDRVIKMNKSDAESSTSRQSALDDIIKMEERAKEKANSRVILKTSYQQIEIMLEFMERHGDLSVAGSGLRGRYYMVSVKWQELTQKLNRERSGDSRSVEKWRKVWSDLKNNMKKKAAKTSDISTVDRRIMNIIRKRDGLEGIPLDEFDQKPSEVALEAPPFDYLVLEHAAVDECNPGTSSDPLHVRAPCPAARSARVQSLPEPTSPQEDMSPLEAPAETSEMDVAAAILERNEIEREKLRLKEVELNMQGEWLQVMREGLSAFREYLDRSKKD